MNIDRDKILETKEEIMRIVQSKKRGFTLLEIMIIVSIIGLLAAISIPNFIKARSISERNVCINNLRQVSAAIQQYALEMKKSPSSAVNLDDLVPYLKGPVVCPSGGKTLIDSYSVTIVGAEPTCLQSPQTHLLP